MTDFIRYAAFISYSSADSQFARRLHKALEGYVLPRKLGRFHLVGGGKPNRVYPVFRDREELSAGDLGKRIESALRSSFALIVVCSPNSVASSWVQKEIEFFASLGRADRIYAIIPDDAPLEDADGADAISSCLPSAFRGDALSGAHEQLAADARKGKDGFRLAFLKLVAGLFDVTPGDLVDRDRRRRKGQTALTASSLSGLALVLSAAGAFVDANRWRSELTTHAERLVGEGRSAEAAAFALAGLPSRGDLIAFATASANEALTTTGLSAPVVAEFGRLPRDDVGYTGGYFSPDGRFLLTQDDELQGRLFDLLDLEMSPVALGRIAVSGSYFSPSGRYLITESSEGVSSMRDLAAPDEPLIDLGAVTFVDFSDDERFIVISDGNEDGWLCDTASGCANRSSIGVTRVLGGFSPNARHVVVVDNGFPGNRRLYDTSGRLRRIWEGRSLTTRFSPDGRFLVVQNESIGGLYDLDLDDVTAVATFGIKEMTDYGPEYEFFPDESFMVVSGPEGILVRDLVAQSEELIAPNADYFELSGTGDHLFVIRTDPSVDLYRDAFVYDMTTPSAEPLSLGGIGRVQCGFSPDGQFLVTEDEDGSSWLHHLSEQDSEPVPLDYMTGCEFSSDGRFLLAASRWEDERVYDLTAPHEGPIFEGDFYDPQFGGRFFLAVDGLTSEGAVFDLETPSRPPVRLGPVEAFDIAGEFLLTVGPESDHLLRRLGDTHARSRADACRAGGNALRPFPSEVRHGEARDALHLSEPLRGRLWNPCDWRGLLAIWPDPERGDGWFEGPRQWMRLVAARMGGADRSCEETTSRASESVRSARARMCARTIEEPDEFEAAG